MTILCICIVRPPANPATAHIMLLFRTPCSLSHIETKAATAAPKPCNARHPSTPASRERLVTTALDCTLRARLHRPNSPATYDCTVAVQAPCTGGELHEGSLQRGCKELQAGCKHWKPRMSHRYSLQRLCFKYDCNLALLHGVWYFIVHWTTMLHDDFTPALLRYFNGLPYNMCMLILVYDLYMAFISSHSCKKKHWALQVHRGLSVTAHWFSVVPSSRFPLCKRLKTRR